MVYLPPSRIGTVPVICKNCALEFLAVARELRRGWGVFCSRNCQRTYQAKINATAMKDGKTQSERVKEWRERTPPEVRRAHDLVYEAIKRGDLVRQPCEICGSARVDGHHDDYSKPLEVRWLCRGHHLAHHRSK